jgi:hypothetical protein
MLVEEYDRKYDRKYGVRLRHLANLAEKPRGKSGTASRNNVLLDLVLVTGRNVLPGSTLREPFGASEPSFRDAQCH